MHEENWLDVFRYWPLRTQDTQCNEKLKQCLWAVTVCVQDNTNLIYWLTEAHHSSRGKVILKLSQYKNAYASHLCINENLPLCSSWKRKFPVLTRQKIWWITSIQKYMTLQTTLLKTEEELYLIYLTPHDPILVDVRFNV